MIEEDTAYAHTQSSSYRVDTFSSHLLSAYSQQAAFYSAYSLAPLLYHPREANE